MTKSPFPQPKYRSELDTARSIEYRRYLVPSESFPFSSCGPLLPVVRLGSLDAHKLRKGIANGIDANTVFFLLCGFCALYFFLTSIPHEGVVRVF